MRFKIDLKFWKRVEGQMRYNFETLGDERFQQLSSALITREFPSAQALPVGQPDGGRDAFLRNRDGDFEVVFQVKYSRDPSNKNERDAIISLVKSEAEKIEELKRRGLKKYYFITNISGTSHLDAGSVDLLNHELSKSIGVETMCWWRADLDARIDGNSSVKWSYPEITSGPDVIQLLLNGDFGERSRSRNNALRAYLAKQYEDERDLKFKQVDLESNVFGLFTDLFVTIKSEGDSVATEEEITRINRNATEILRTEMRSLGIALNQTADEKIKASSLFTCLALSETIPQVVLEGGPGQGKSTITQYIAQVNRARFLNNLHDIANVPDAHRLSPVKLPFRLDLRDYASWISVEARAAEADNRHPIYSLEKFLSQQIQVHSGGFNFGVEDLSDVLAIGNSLLFLDGFDEVADVELRRVIIQEATAAASRIRGLGYFCQIVVTSRPTAFVNAPSFSDPRWRHVELDAVEKAQIGEYLSRWVRAKALSTADAEQFGLQVMRRMDESHIAELARNPMQLAILLSLMWAHGESLPEKRTALYRSYVELFLNREAEKDKIIKEYRELILELHGYIAWILQTKVEVTKSDGRISEADMLSAIETYIDKEEYGSGIVNHLFRAMRQRVVAIVSRVEGTYEFEVQPLREFFAGQFLYDTAAYSPTGSEAKGTLPDRFSAIVRNPYWSNVTRFYAGCYSKGELASLAEGLEEYLLDSTLGTLRAPSVMSLTLISDWVFSQSVPSMKRLLSHISNNRRLRIMASSVFSRNGSAISLPDRCGRKILLEASLEALKSCSINDERMAFAQISRANSSPSERLEYWNGRRDESKSKSDWISEGLLLNIFSEHDISVDIKRSLVSDVSNDDLSDFISTLSATDIDDHVIFEWIKRAALCAEEHIYFNEATIVYSKSSMLSALSSIGQNDFIAGVSRGNPEDPLWHYMNVFYRPPQEDGGISEAEIAWTNQLFKATRQNISDWRSDPKLWSVILDDAIAIWGKQFGFLKFALVGALAIEGDESFRESAILDEAGSPLDWARSAKSPHADLNWWMLAFSGVRTEMSAIITVAAFILWADCSVIHSMRDELYRCIDSMTGNDFDRLAQLLVDLGGRHYRQDENSESIDFGEPSARAATAFLSADRRWMPAPLLPVLINYAGIERSVHRTRMNHIFNAAISGTASWDVALSSAEDAYRCGAVGIPYNWYIYRDEYESFPLDMAKKVLETPEKYPIYLINASHAVVQSSVEAITVTEISERERWFEGQLS